MVFLNCLSNSYVDTLFTVPKRFMKYILLVFLISLSTVYGQEINTYFLKVDNTERAKKSEESIDDFLETKEVSLFSEIHFKRRKKSNGGSSLFVLKTKLSEADLDRLRSLSSVVSIEQEPRLEVLVYPNDPYADTLLESFNGQSPLVTHNFYDAWDIEKGDSNVVMGFVDTGIWFDHRDIQDNLKNNFNDPINGVNEDNDSLLGVPLIDNYYGWDVANWDNDPTMSGSRHGLEVIGISSATFDNELNIAGLAPNVKYMPIKACRDDMPGSITDGYLGLLYAAEQGAKVVNLSWGSPMYPGDVFQDLIDYVTNDLDVVVVAAAGNSFIEEKYFPASLSGVISVTGIRVDSSKQALSTFDYSVDLNAVGWKSNTLSTTNDSSMVQVSGTSYAAPVVTAIAGLIASNQPSFTSEQIKKQMEITSAVIDTMGFNLDYRWKMGRMVDPVAALSDFDHPGYTIADAERLDTIQIGQSGDSVLIDVTLKNVFRNGQGVTVRVVNMEGVFPDSDQIISIDSGATEMITIGGFLESDSLVDGTLYFRIEFIGADYYDYEMLEVPYEVYSCQDTSTLNYAVTVNESDLLFEGVNSSEAYISYTIDGELSKYSMGQVNDTSFVFVYVESGLLENIWLHVDECSILSDSTLQVEVINGLSSVESEQNFFFPNPTSGVIFPNSDYSIESIEVLDNLGNSYGVFEIATHFDLSFLPNGSYLVRVIAEGNTTTHKLIKN